MSDIKVDHNSPNHKKWECDYCSRLIPISDNSLIDNNSLQDNIYLDSINENISNNKNSSFENNVDDLCKNPEFIYF